MKAKQHTKTEYKSGKLVVFQNILKSYYFSHFFTSTSQIFSNSYLHNIIQLCITYMRTFEHYFLPVLTHTVSTSKQRRGSFFKIDYWVGLKFKYPPKSGVLFRKNTKNITFHIKQGTIFRGNNCKQNPTLTKSKPAFV